MPNPTPQEVYDFTKTNLNDLYPNYAAFSSDLDSRIEALDLPPDLEAKVRAQFETIRPLERMFASSSSDDLNQFAVDTMLEKVQEISAHYATKPGVIAGAMAVAIQNNSTLSAFEALDVVKAGFGTVSHAMIGVAGGLTVGTATLAALQAEADGYAWTSPQMAAIKEFSLGTAGSIGAILGGVGATALGMSPVFGAFLIGAVTVAAVDNVWDNIEVRVAEARVLGITDHSDIASFVVDSIMSDINSLIDQTGQAAIDFIDSIPDYADHLWDATVSGVKDIGAWFNDVIEKFVQATTRNSPLVLDLDGNGVELVAADSVNAVYWNYTMDDFAKAGGWIAGGDGLLAIDLNADGVINNSGELFGDQTGFANGFLALAGFDSNDDGFITAEDAEFSDLLVWIDASMDGYSQTDELHSMSSLLITSINLDYDDVSYAIAGNIITQESSFIINGSTRDIVDVHFAYDSKNTIYSGDYTLDLDVLGLPILRGYGNLPDLHIAMSLDNAGAGNLLGLVETLNAKTFAQLFDATSVTPDLVRGMMYRWAGVEGVSPTARGIQMDARELAFLEAMMGQGFLQNGYAPDPGYEAAFNLKEAFAIEFNNIYARVLAQGSGIELFTGSPFYNVATDTIEGITGLNTTKLSELQSEATGLANTATRQAFWVNVLRMIEFAQGVDNLPSGAQTALSNAIEGSDSALDMAAMLSGLGGNGTMYGSGDNDLIYGDNLANTLNGNAGNDRIESGGGDDILTGGTGSDYLVGWVGDDTYAYNSGDGWDYARDEGGTGDKIQFGAGITSGEVTIDRIGQYDLAINIADGANIGQIYIENMFFTNGGIEMIDFAAGADITLSTYGFTMTGTSGNDTLYGVTNGTGGANDTINGLGGNDVIYGYDGTNALNGGDGDDTITGGSGVDTIDGGAGNDRLYGGTGNDLLTGGAGDDYVDGSLNNDTYYYTGGHDTYVEGGGTDSIVLTGSYSQANTVYYRIGNDLKIIFGTDGANDITIGGFYFSGQGIETLDFASGTDVTLTTVSTITQGDENDNLMYGTGNADILYGMGGNDTIWADGAGDTLYGGAGNDTLNGQYGDDILDGGAGDDILTGEFGSDTYIYVSGIDTIMSDGSGTEEIIINGGWAMEDLSFKRYNANPTWLKIEINGANSITARDHFYSGGAMESLTIGGTTLSLTDRVYETYGTTGNDTISGITAGGSINDVIFGLGGGDTIYGGVGNDTLYGEDGADYLYGGDDNDTLNGGAGSDWLEGQAGNNTYIFDIGGGTDTVAESDGTNYIRVVSGMSVEDLAFSLNAGASTLTISRVANSTDAFILTGFSAGVANPEYTNLVFDDGFTMDLANFTNWVFLTSSGNFTGAGTTADTVIGRSVHDNIKGMAGNDTLYGAGGDDAVYGYDGDDFVHGGDGDDTTLRGGNGNDTIWGGDGRDNVRGEAGNDVIYGGAGNDGLTVAGVTFYLKGDAGDDIIYGDAGEDYLRGDSGRDQLYGGDDNDDARGGSGDDLIYGDAGNDVLEGDDGDDEIHGGDGNDTIRGEEGEDLLYGDAGNDDIRGGTDDNVIYGGTGDDVIYGGLGDDVVDGGSGDDNLQANGGDDTYIVSTGHDYISDSGSGTNGDRLVFGDGVDMDDLAFSIINTDNLRIDWGSVNNIEVENQAKTSSSLFIEKLVLGDGSAFTFNNYIAGWTFVTGSSHTGNSSANTIIGNGSAQTLSGAAGNDEIHGGAGVDTLNGGDNDDLLHGGRGNDTLNGDGGNDTLNGGEGNDAINGGSGDDTYIVTSGIETITDTGGSDRIKFSGTIESYAMTFANLDADSSGDNDDLKITLSAGIDELILLDQRNANANLKIDTILFTDGFQLSVNRYGTSAWISSDSSSISGSSGADTILGGASANTINGNDGDDEIYGAAGNDTLNGGNGIDLMHGGDGNDIIKGNAGIDTIYGGSGADTIYGGSSGTSDTTGETDYLYGGDGNDAIYGGHGDDFVYGEAGNDATLRGFEGNDTLYGGSGDDGINGNNGNDTIYGDDGDDILNGDGGSTETGNDMIHGGFGVDTINGNAGTDTLYGDSGDDTVIGGMDADTIYGGSGIDKLYGGLSSTDTTDTSADTLYGDDGDDTLYGNAGDDILSGGAGADILRGDTGADTFLFMDATSGVTQGIDTIMDFNWDSASSQSDSNGDKIDLHNILDAAFDPVTHSITDFINFTTVGADSALFVDRDGTGSGTAEKIATFAGLTNLDGNEAYLYNEGYLLVS